MTCSSCDGSCTAVLRLVSHVLPRRDALPRARARSVSLLGRNGAGKSTTLKAIVGLVEVTGGAHPLRRPRVTAAADARDQPASASGYVPEDRRIFADLTVEENLTVGAKGGGRVERGARLPVLPQARLELAGRRAGSLSGGEQQMLTVARTLMGNPRVLLLDEPSEGLAPVIVRALGDADRRAQARGLDDPALRAESASSRRGSPTAPTSSRRARSGSTGPWRQLMADEALRRKYLTV